jgi:hypothetical protein
MYPTSLCLNFGFPTLLGCDGPLVVIRDVEAYGPVLVQLRLVEIRNYPFIDFRLKGGLRRTRLAESGFPRV